MMLGMCLNSHIKILTLTKQKFPVISYVRVWVAAHPPSMAGSPHAEDLHNSLLPHLR